MSWSSEAVAKGERNDHRRAGSNSDSRSNPNTSNLTTMRLYTRNQDRSERRNEIEIAAAADCKTPAFPTISQFSAAERRSFPISDPCYPKNQTFRGFSGEARHSDGTVNSHADKSIDRFWTWSHGRAILKAPKRPSTRENFLSYRIGKSIGPRGGGSPPAKRTRHQPSKTPAILGPSPSSRWASSLARFVVSPGFPNSQLSRWA